MTPDEQLCRARSEFERRAAVVQPGDLGRPTPCAEWDVAALLRHVVGGARGYLRLLDGAAADEFRAAAAAYELGADPAAEFRRTGADLVEAFRAAPPDRTVHHPAGDMPAERLLGMCVGEWTVHAWDLARAVGTDEALDAGLVAALYERYAPQREWLAVSGYFGPSRGVSGDAPVQARLLDVLGR